MVSIAKYSTENKTMAWAAFNKNHSSAVRPYLARKCLLGSVWQEQGSWRAVDKDRSPEYLGFVLLLIQDRSWLYSAVPSAMWALLSLQWQLWTFQRRLLVNKFFGSNVCTGRALGLGRLRGAERNQLIFLWWRSIYNNLLELRGSCKLAQCKVE